MLNGRVVFAEEISHVRNSVVRVTVVSQVSDYSLPWNPGKLSTSRGAGFVISNNRILTNAHIVSDARFIVVQKEDDSRNYEARVKFIAHDCDLAMLEVLDKSFFVGVKPLSLGGLPLLDSTVLVIGYPIGGNRLSVTRGVVSRIDFRIYSHSSADSHLTIQIDAAINPGNSGGPVMQNNKVVGVAFQGFRGDVAQNVGYMIPTPVIERFLKDIEDGQYDHYVDLAIMYFPLLNNTHRRALGLEPGDFGVVVSKVLTAGASNGILRVGDVLLSIDGLSIFSNGSVELDGDRTQLSEVVERKFKGDSVRLEVFRAGEKMEVTVPLSRPWPYLMQARTYEVKPRFVVFGGLVFQPLSKNFLKKGTIKKADVLYQYLSFIEDELYLETPEIIVISKILPDPINAYLDDFAGSIVESVNDRKIETLEDISDAFDEVVDFYVIKLKGEGRPLVLERKEVEKARGRILKGYGVISERYLGDSIVPKNWKSPSGSGK
jgi:S1-C subfamily serine protease